MMKVSEIASKYGIDKFEFEDFLFCENLKYSGSGDYRIKDYLVEEYVEKFKVYKEERIRVAEQKDKYRQKSEEAKLNRKETENEEEIDPFNPGIVTPIDGAVYSINGVRGRHIDIFENKCIITTKVTLGSLLTHNATDGAKTIYYADVVGVQFKEPGITIGYLQLETPGLTMNNTASNFFNENSFTFDTSVVTTKKMKEIAAYVESRVQEIKHPSTQPPSATVSSPFSVADELLKFKQLLDMGALTQEEFDAKKKELLNL